MGAFFLFKDKCDLDLQAVELVFLRKGFTNQPFKCHMKDWTLWLYRKQLLGIDNYVEDEEGYSVYATGTVVYKGLGYSDSLKYLLSDFKNESIDTEKLIGNFCVLFWDGSKITFLTDALNVHHVFIDKKRSRISTSFLAMVASHTQKLKINKLGVFEKLAAGYILSPDTLVEDIQQIDESLKGRLQKECPGIVWKGGWQGSDSGNSFHDRGFKDSLESQIAVLKSYFHQVNNIHNEYKGELGLSAGYDSRLLLACGSSFLSSPLAIHSHNTKGVHNFEYSVAREIADLKKVKIHSVETTHIERQNPERIPEILLDGLYFYDARCSYDMGAYSETYTGKYKKNVLGDNRLSFNGLGGEILRNEYYTARQRFNTLEWMKAHLYYYYADESLNNSDLFQEVHSHMISKLGKRVHTDITQRMSFFEMRRYYSEVRMPDCNGINHNAQNQIAFYLTPFIEPIVVREALMATPFIGSDGKYQAELIRLLDPDIASVPSHYGFSFDRIPVSHRLYSFMKGHIPERVWNLRHRYLKKRGRGQHLRENYLFAKRRCDYLSDIEMTFSDFFPGFNWQAAMCEDVQKATTIFMASFLHEFSNKLTL